MTTSANKTITVKIVADTRPFRRALLEAQHRLTKSWWRRLALRVAMWRL